MTREPKQLTASGRLKFSPVFCNDGREIVFVELVDPTLYRLQKLDVATGKVKPLHADAPTSEFEPTWAADGQCYAYLKTRSALSIGIVVRDAQGTTIGDIPPEPGFFGFRSPTLAPNKARVAFAYGVDGAQQIFTSEINGKDRKALTNTKGLNQWPSYSLDGKLITFSSSRDGTFDVYVMRADGTEQRRLTDHPLSDIRPRFSPDGKRIAFTSHRDGNAKIYVINADGTNLRRVTNHAERDDYPSWHPDGKNLVTVSERKGKRELFLWELDD
jgi:TolB protein